MYTVLNRIFNSFEEVIKFAEDEHEIYFLEPLSILTEEEKEIAIIELEKEINTGGFHE